MPSRDEMLRSELTGETERDLQTLRALLHIPENRDAVERRHRCVDFGFTLFYMEGMAGDAKISEFILRASKSPAASGISDPVGWLKEESLEVAQCERESRIKELLTGILGGMTCVLADGCAEALKTAVLFDPDLFSHLAAHGTDFDRMTVLPRCIACKRDAVCADEFDRGARQLLNLGHTAGHAIETLSGYRIAHGHAVAIGLAIMARAFCRDAAEIEAALIKLGLPTRTEFSPERLAQAALADKKRAGERITLVIPRAIGDCVLREVPVDTLPDIFERGM